MKKTRCTEEQMAFALKQAETGTRVGEVCRKMGTSEATFYNWKKKFADLGVTELRRLRQLEDESMYYEYLQYNHTQISHIAGDLSMNTSPGTKTKWSV